MVFFPKVEREKLVLAQDLGEGRTHQGDRRVHGDDRLKSWQHADESLPQNALAAGYP